MQGFRIGSGRSFGAVDAHASQVFTQGFEEVVEFIAHVSDAESGALADLVVFEVFVVLEFQEGPVLVPEFGQEEPSAASGTSSVDSRL